MTRKHISTGFDSSAILPYLGGIFAVGCWGLSFVATKILLDGGLDGVNDNISLSPTEAYIYRFAVAYFIILLFCHKRIMCRNLKDEFLMMLCGMSSGSIYFIAENTALELTYTSNVSLLSGTSPLVTMLIVGILYKTERPGRGMIMGSCVAFAGVCCVILNSATSIDIRPIGDLLALSTAFCWAFYSLIVKKLNVVYDDVFITRKTFFYGVVTALPFLLFEGNIRNPLTVIQQGWPWVDGSLIFLVLGPSVLAFYLWAVTIRKLGAVVSNNFMYFQPVVTVIASALILGEKISTLGYTGFVLILFGLWLGYYLEKQMGVRLK